MGFTKLDERLLQSSIMLEDPPTFKVWITLLAACGPDGIAPVSSVFLASVCHLDIGIVDKALEKLEAPDPRSRTTEEEGRRIKRVDGGFFVINYEKYRSFTYSKGDEAFRKRKYREALKSGTTPDKSGQPGTAGDSPDTSASASGFSSSLKARKKERPDGFDVRAREINAMVVNRGFSFLGTIIDYIADLTFEFKDLDWKEEIEKKLAHLLKERPSKKRLNVALQFRNWFTLARKFKAERDAQDRVGQTRPAGAAPPVDKEDFETAQNIKIREIMEKWKTRIEDAEARDPFEPLELESIKRQMRGELEEWTADWMRKHNEQVQSGPEDEEGPL